MLKPRIHNRISCSTTTLVVSTIAATLLWWPADINTRSALFALFLAFAIGYMKVETDIVYQLLRVTARTIGALWFMGFAIASASHTYHPSLAATLLLAVSYYCLFRTYQDVDSAADTFHSYLLLAFGALFYAPLLLMLPFFLWHQMVFMRSLSLRTFSAALIGFSAPFWFWTFVMLFREDFAPLQTWWGTIGFTAFSMPDFLALWTPQFLLDNAGFLLFVVLGLISTIYYLNNSYDDKIRVRMMIYIYIFQSLLVMLFAAWQPTQMDALMPLLVLNVSVPLAHCFALSRSWFTFALFLLSVLAWLAVVDIEISDNIKNILL